MSYRVRCVCSSRVEDDVYINDGAKVRFALFGCETMFEALQHLQRQMYVQADML